MISLKKMPVNEVGSRIQTQRYTDSSVYTSTKCLNSPFQKNMYQTTTEKVLRQHFPNVSNKFLTSDTQTNTYRHRIVRYPSIGSLPSNRIIFKSNHGVSLKQVNVSFTFTSPPKSRKHHSSGARFSTKKFKEQHFPLLGHDEDNGSMIKRIVKSKQRDAETIYTREKTPDKHRILKSKKPNDNFTFFDREEKENNPKIANCGFDPQIKRKVQSNNDENRPTRDVWLPSSRQQKKSLQNSSKYLPSNNKSSPTSIEFIKISNHAHSKKQVKGSMVSPTFEKSIQSPQPLHSNKKYPTLQSVDVYQNIKSPSHKAHQNGRVPSKKEPTSLKLVNQQSQKLSSFHCIQGSAEDIQLAKSIVEELQLNYDYYFALDDSDKSLSFHVAL